MKINYYNFDYLKNLDLPSNLKEVNNHINSVLKELPALQIINNEKELQKIINTTEGFKKNKNKFLLFGIGGSSLGARALINIADNQSNKIFFYDNIDPIYFEKSLLNIDFKSTGFIFISKSGTTAETLSQLGSLIELAINNNSLDDFYTNSLIITEFKPSPLYNIAKKNNCLLLEHHKDIGGRYSVFSNVGMVPAFIAGLDIKAIHQGAQEAININNKQNFYQLGQIFKYINHHNFNSTVIMTYSDLLFYFGKWYLQLWSESIGKDGKGVTSIHAVGTTDQHSQVQLYLDGPKDKFFTFLTTNHSKKGLKINNIAMQEEGLDYLVNKKMGDLMHAEQEATIDTFKKNNFVLRNIYIDNINSYSLGYLMASSIIETIAACIYFDVNPFNQPAVEQGKNLTKKYLI